MATHQSGQQRPQHLNPAQHGQRVPPQGGSSTAPPAQEQPQSSPPTPQGAPTHKLNWTICGRRQLSDDQFGMDYVDVEWRHDDGPITDYEIHPVTHPPNIKYEKRESGKRDVIKDQIVVKRGTPDSVVMQMLEERRAGIAKSLGVDP